MSEMRHITKALLAIAAIWLLAPPIRSLLQTPLYTPASPEADTGFCGTSLIDGTVYSPTGKRLFQQNCQTCHALNKDLTGPALRGFKQRGPWANQNEVYQWIHNPGAYLRKSKYARRLQREYVAMMAAFPQLTPAQIDEITYYITGVKPTVQPAFPQAGGK